MDDGGPPSRELRLVFDTTARLLEAVVLRLGPGPTTVAVPRLRDGEPIQLPGYPIHMVHAEKIVTAVQRATANTRWRDLGDIWSLSRRHSVAADDLARAIEQVARRRHATLHPLADALDGYAQLGQDC